VVCARKAIATAFGIRQALNAGTGKPVWLIHTLPSLVAQHLNIDKAAIAVFPNDGPLIIPE
jgi:hypothetical protein